MRATDADRRLEFLDLTPQDLELLEGLGESIEAHADALVSAFYRHLVAFEPTRQLLRDPLVRERLLAKQREYLLSLAGPEIDERYVEDRRRIGTVHARIGLEPRWYLGAYSLYFSLLAPIVRETYPDADTATRAVTALQKLLTHDMQLALESYILGREHELESTAEELAREGLRLARQNEAQRVALARSGERAREAEARASIATVVAGLAHEIGTPMGVIQGHAKMLEASVTGEDAEWRLATIREQISRISKIMQTLVNMARPHRGTRVLVPLGAVVESTLGFLTERLARNGIELDLDLDLGAGSSILGDPERIQQLFLNLFLNAADAMPEGGRLSVQQDTDGDAGTRVRVADTGGGIAPEHIDRVFEPFFSTKGAGGGSGLGLAVCQGIVNDHGGSIEVRSAEGEGTTFEIHFPGAE